jgi:hypothetical protein
VEQGPVQVSPWGRPGRLKVRLCSTPLSAFVKEAVTVAPAGTWTVVLSNARLAAVREMLTADGCGADVAVAAGCGAVVGVAAAATRVGALVAAVVDSAVAGAGVEDSAAVTVVEVPALAEAAGDEGAVRLALGEGDAALAAGSLPSSPLEQAVTATARHATARATTRLRRMCPAIE